MKTMFLWESVNEGLTCNWHSGGGAVVIASSKEDAFELLKSYGVSEHSEIFTSEPDFVTSVIDQEDKIFIFQDAGCC